LHGTRLHEAAGGRASSILNYRLTTEYGLKTHKGIPNGPYLVA